MIQVSAVAAANGLSTVFVRGLNNTVWHRTALSNGDYGPWTTIPAMGATTGRRGRRTPRGLTMAGDPLDSELQPTPVTTEATNGVEPHDDAAPEPVGEPVMAAAAAARRRTPARPPARAAPAGSSEG